MTEQILPIFEGKRPLRAVCAKCVLAIRTGTCVNLARLRVSCHPLLFIAPIDAANKVCDAGSRQNSRARDLEKTNACRGCGKRMICC